MSFSKRKEFTANIHYLLLNSLMVLPKPIVPNALISAVVFSSLSPS